MSRVLSYKGEGAQALASRLKQLGERLRRWHLAQSACAGIALLAAASAPSAAAPGGAYVDLALVLAVDVSASMDSEEQGVQRRGYAEAFRHPAVISAIRNGPTGRIAVTYVEWAEQASQTIPWTVIASERDARAFAARLDAEPITTARRTSISNALSFASTLLTGGGVQAGREVIDISGDGANNAGPAVDVTRDSLVARGVIINGLPILLNKPAQWYDIANLDQYYRDCVVGGRGAFVLAVHSIEELAGTIRNKMVTEIAGLSPSEGGFQYARAHLRRAQSKTDCMIGEKKWGGQFYTP
jgi:hypothetical protein